MFQNFKVESMAANKLSRLELFESQLAKNSFEFNSSAEWAEPEPQF